MKSELTKEEVSVPKMWWELEQKIFHRDINISTYTVLCVADRQQGEKHFTRDRKVRQIGQNGNSFKNLLLQGFSG